LYLIPHPAKGMKKRGKRKSMKEKGVARKEKGGMERGRKICE